VTCLICGRARRGGLMCAACARSYDRSAHRDGSVFEAMVWAAGRARRAERARGEARASDEFVRGIRVGGETAVAGMARKVPE
jgi:hypothetical protein